MSGASGRVVTLIDMDCFYCQVEARLNPEHKGKPLAVVQYNLWKGGGIIAVNYEARDKGVTRGMRGDQAKQKCPDIVLVSVASVRGKADLSKYRDAGKEVVDVFKEFCDCVERASIDEAYLDLTQVVEKRTQKLQQSGIYITSDKLHSTFIVGFCPNKSNAEDTRIAGLKEFLEDQKFNPETLRLTVAALVVEELRGEILKRTGFHCSAGIAHNKVLAKLVCGMHKPRRQTVLPISCVEELFSALPVHKVRNLGGKFGVKVVEELGCDTMGDLAKFSKEELQQKFDEKTGSWLYEISRGIDSDPVTPRLIPKSIGCSKNFPGKNCLKTKDDVEHWMKELCDEVADRLSQDLQENKRRAQLLTVTVSLDGQSTSRSGALSSYDAPKLVAEALSLIARSNTAPANSLAWQPAIYMIAVSASKFVSDEGFRCTGIQSFFKQTSKADRDEAEVRISGISKENRIDNSNNPSKVSPKIDSFFKSQPQKSQVPEKSTFSQKEGQTKCIEKEPGNSFFLNYLQKLKSEPNRTNATPPANDSKPSSSSSVDVNESTLSNRSSLNTSGRSDTSSKSEKSDDSLILIMEMFPNPLDVEESVVNLLSTSMQETFYKWRSQFRRENGCVSPEKVKLNSRRNGVNKVAVDFTSPKKQKDNQKSPNKPIRPKGVIDSFLQQKGPILEQGDLRYQSDPDDPDPQPGSSHQYPFSEDSNSMFNIDENSCDEMERCSICHKMILLREFPEHADYHAALSLDERLNKEQAVPPARNSAAQTAAKSNTRAVIPAKKRGRAGKTDSNRPQDGKKLKSISSFFSVKGST